MTELNKLDISTRMNNGRFISNTGDKYIVKFQDCLSSSILVEIQYDGFIIDFTLSNKIDAWEFLAELDDMGGRSVFVELHDGELVEYKKSGPFKYRF